jgi:hypothetical protein
MTTLEGLNGDFEVLMGEFTEEWGSLMKNAKIQLILSASIVKVLGCFH